MRVGVNSIRRLLTIPTPIPGSGPLFNTTAEQITGLWVMDMAAKSSVELSKDTQGNWQVTSPEARSADPTQAQSLASQFANVYVSTVITTATDLVIPVGAVVNLELSSGDVIHSFWIPQLNGKTDAFPNHVNKTWIQANTPGAYYGQCAELCGASHANMRVVVIVKTPEEFDQWVKDQQAAPAQPTDPLALQGQLVFLSGACVGCHTIEGTAAQGKVGPNLTHVGSRSSIAGGALTNTEGNLKRWLANSPGIKPGSVMPNLNLGAQEVDALTAYMQSLK